MPKRMIPVSTEDALTANVSFRISPRLQARAKQASQRTGLPMSTVLRRALERWSQDPDTFVTALWPEQTPAAGGDAPTSAFLV